MNSVLGERVTIAPWTVALAIGDALALVVFILIGAVEHNIDPATYPGRIAGNVVPFLVSWYVVALVGGLYTYEAVESVRRALLWSVPAWVVAVFIAQAIRSTEYFPGSAPVAFILVSLLFGGLFLLGWRLLATVVLGRVLREDSDTVSG